MDADTIADLKQFIAATVSQESVLLEERLEHRLERKLEQKLEEKLDVKLREFAQGISNAIYTLAESIDGKLDNHEKRIRILENRAS